MTPSADFSSSFTNKATAFALDFDAACVCATLSAQCHDGGNDKSLQLALVC